MSPGTLVSARDREWVVQPSDDPDLLLLKPLGGTEDEITGINKPLGFAEDAVKPATFQPPGRDDLGDFATARLLYESARLAFRNGSGPFRCLAKLSFRPRAYQIVPLVMALRQERVRLLVADDVGVGKTIEALLIIRELLERRRIRRFAVVCLPHLCDQWQAEIHSKLGLEAVVIRSNTQARLDRHFIQRKRADVEKWIGRDSTETTPFPIREPLEWDYTLSPRYNAFFERILEFCQGLVRGEDGGHRQRVRYWTALGLLRGVMSSPAAGARMLRNRMSKVDLDDSADDRLAEDPEDNPVHDSDHGFDTDAPPTAVVARTDWTDHQKRRLSEFAAEIEALANPKDDQKLAAAEYLIDDLLKDGFCPVVFCRYIPTARYVGEQLGPRLSAKHAGLDVQVVTSEDPDDVRRQRIEGMGTAARRVLIATDCLSEGINLQEHFTAVLHYDLPWNPNRLEQREGRVDRFGQIADTVKAYLLFGGDNPIDGIVLDVLLRKVREIKKATGINVPFPEDSKSVIDTIAQALLVNPDRKITSRRRDNQLEFGFSQFPEAEAVKIQSTNELEKAAEREKASRSIFAQHAIKAQEIEQDLHEMDEALGDPRAVERFVVQALSGIFGAQCDPSKHGHRLHPGNLPASLNPS